MNSEDFEAVMNGTYVEPFEEPDDDDEVEVQPETFEDFSENTENNE